MSVVIYTKAHCPYCQLAKQLFTTRNVSYTEVRVDLDESKREEMLRLSGNRRTVPQIFINHVGIGGYEDLAALAASGELDRLLNTHQNQKGQ